MRIDNDDLREKNEELYEIGLNENTARLGDMRTIERLEDKVAEQKAEIERLTEGKTTLAKAGGLVTEINENLIKINETLVEKGKELQNQVDTLKVSWNILCDFLGEEICKQGENEDIFTEILDKVNEILQYDADLAKYKYQAVKDTAREFARLVEFHSVATMENGVEYFTISSLGLSEILHENFGVEYSEIYPCNGVEVE